MPAYTRLAPLFNASSTSACSDAAIGPGDQNCLVLRWSYILPASEFRVVKDVDADDVEKLGSHFAPSSGLRRCRYWKVDKKGERRDARVGGDKW